MVPPGICELFVRNMRESGEYAKHLHGKTAEKATLKRIAK
jgi:hypothetical protein